MFLPRVICRDLSLPVLRKGNLVRLLALGVLYVHLGVELRNEGGHRPDHVLSGVGLQGYIVIHNNGWI